MEMWDRGVLMGVEVLLCPPHLFICWFAWLQDSSAKARRTETGHAQQGEPLASLRVNLQPMGVGQHQMYKHLSTH